MRYKNRVFRFLQKTKINPKSPNFRKEKPLKIHILNSQSQQKYVAFQSVFIAIRQGNGYIVYEIFFVNLWVIILCLVSVHYK